MIDSYRRDASADPVRVLRPRAGMAPRRCKFPMPTISVGLVVLRCVACASADPVAPTLPSCVLARTCPREAGAEPSPARAEWQERTPGWIWGVTIDDVSALEDTVDSLRSLPVRATARVVFDAQEGPAHYTSAVKAIHRVSDVMGEILDSQAIGHIDVGAYRARARDYLEALGSDVDVWEIGNEVNGDWLGPTPEVVAKISAAYDEARARRVRTALTLHYEEGCGASIDHGMFRWADTNLPSAMRAGLDQVLVSYYEDDCAGRQPDWPAVFRRLAPMFPRAVLGFGECGTAHPAAKEAQLLRDYRIRIDEPRFVGGFFWWYFSEDMVPKTRPLWDVLRRVTSGG